MGRPRDDPLSSLDLLGLPEDCFGRRLNLDDVQSYLRGKGEFTLEASALVARAQEPPAGGGLSTDIGTYERSRPNGVTLEIHTMALPDGGVHSTLVVQGATVGVHGGLSFAPVEQST